MCSGLCQPDYYDVVCRNTTPLVKHSTPLLYNLEVDPGELYQLDTGKMENQKILQEIDEVIVTCLLICSYIVQCTYYAEC